MPYKKKQNTGYKIPMLIGAIVLTVLVIAAAGIFGYMAYKNDKEAKEAAALDALPRIVVPSGHFAEPTFAKAEVKKDVRAATITPGIDIYTNLEADQAAIEAEVDKIIDDIKALSLNAIFLDLSHGTSVCFNSTKLEKTPVDLLDILIKKATEQSIPVSVIFNLRGVDAASGDYIGSFLPFENRELMADALTELAQNYTIDSVLLNHYYAPNDGDSYAVYQQYGSMGDYKTWLRDNVNVVIDQVRNEAKIAKETLPIGMVVSSVWAHADNKEGGSATKNAFEALIDGNADTKALVESGAIDFIDVRVDTSLSNGDVSFNTAVSWWSGICKTASIPMYVTHSGESIKSTEAVGWNGIDELTRQVIAASKAEGYYGSTFTGLTRLTKDLTEHPDTANGSAAYLVDFLNGKITEGDAKTDLKIISPTKASSVVYEEGIQFKMQFDPNGEVILNGEKITPSSRGGASVFIPLKVGKNSIKLEHKGKTTVYSVERKVVIFKDNGNVSPAKGAIKVAGSSTIELSALAFAGSKITATINGKTITLTEGGGGDDNLAESGYRTFTGEYTVPKATAKEQSIGKIVFKGNYENIYSYSVDGATITIDKMPDEVDPDTATGEPFTHATVTNMYASTFPFKTTGEYPQAIQYQLPQGTQDIVVSENGNHLNLRSGVTVLKKDVSLETKNFEGNNQVTQMTVGVEGNDTVIRATMNWKSPFSLNLSPYTNSPQGRKAFNFNADTVTILLDYVTVIKPEIVSGDMSASPIFSGISYKRIKNEAQGTWQYAITLPMRQAGRYYGAHAQWEDNTLVFRFNHPPQNGSLSGLKIAVDPGHGGKEPGNTGGRDSVEKNLNLEHAFKLKASLEALGAEVVMTRDGDYNVALEERVKIAERNGCDLFVSVHQNSTRGLIQGPNGVQTYYNAPFSAPLAKYVQESLMTVVQPSQWNFWNGSMDMYNFVVTRERQFPSILVECAFLPNPNDEARAMDPNEQQRLMDALAQGIVNYYAAYN